MSAVAGPSTGAERNRMPRVPKLRFSCDSCHKLKIKCGREKPSCVRCQVHDIPCVYGIARRMGRPRASGATQAIAGNSSRSPAASCSFSSPPSSPKNNRHHQDDARVPSIAPVLDPPVSPSPRNASLDATSPQQDHQDTWPEGFSFSLPSPGTEDFMGDLVLPLNSVTVGGPMDLDIDIGLNLDMPSTDDFSNNDFLARDGDLRLAPEPNVTSILAGTPNSPRQLQTPVPTVDESSRLDRGLNGPTGLTTPGSGHLPPLSNSCGHYLSLLQRLAALEEALHHASPAQQPSSTSPGREVHARPRSGTIQRRSEPPQLALDSLLSLARETLQHCPDVLGCNACVTNASCILILTIVVEKGVGLYETVVGDYGIYSDPQPRPDHTDNSDKNDDNAHAGPLAPIHQRIRLGTYTLHEDEARTLVKTFVRTRLKAIEGLLARLQDVADRLPRVLGQTSPCRVAVDHAWRRLTFVNGMVDLWL